MFLKPLFLSRTAANVKYKKKNMFLSEFVAEQDGFQYRSPKTITNPDQVGFPLLYKFSIKISCNFVRNNNFNGTFLSRKCLNDKEFETDYDDTWIKHLSKICTTLGYIVSQILLNLGHVFHFHNVNPMCHVFQVQEDLWNDITKSCAFLQLHDVSPRIFSQDH